MFVEVYNRYDAPNIWCALSVRLLNSYDRSFSTIYVSVISVAFIPYICSHIDAFICRLSSVSPIPVYPHIVTNPNYFHFCCSEGYGFRKRFSKLFKREESRHQTERDDILKLTLFNCWFRGARWVHFNISVPSRQFLLLHCVIYVVAFISYPRRDVSHQAVCPLIDCLKLILTHTHMHYIFSFTFR